VAKKKRNEQGEFSFKVSKHDVQLIKKLYKKPLKEQNAGAWIEVNKGRVYLYLCTSARRRTQRRIRLTCKAKGQGMAHIPHDLPSRLESCKVSLSGGKLKLGLDEFKQAAAIKEELEVVNISNETLVYKGKLGELREAIQYATSFLYEDDGTAKSDWYGNSPNLKEALPRAIQFYDDKCYCLNSYYMVVYKVCGIKKSFTLNNAAHKDFLATTKSLKAHLSDNTIVKIFLTDDNGKGQGGTPPSNALISQPYVLRIGKHYQYYYETFKLKPDWYSRNFERIMGTQTRYIWSAEFSPNKILEPIEKFKKEIVEALMIADSELKSASARKIFESEFPFIKFGIHCHDILEIKVEAQSKFSELSNSFCEKRWRIKGKNSLVASGLEKFLYPFEFTLNRGYVNKVFSHRKIQNGKFRLYYLGPFQPVVFKCDGLKGGIMIVGTGLESRFDKRFMEHGYAGPFRLGENVIGMNLKGATIEGKVIELGQLLTVQDDDCERRFAMFGSAVSQEPKYPANFRWRNEG